MLHILEPKPIIFDLVPRLSDVPPGPLRDVLDLAELEMPRWPEQTAAIEGPTAVSFLSTESVFYLLKGLRHFGEVEFTEPEITSQKITPQLAVGNPGPAGTENLALETTLKQFEFSPGSKTERKISNRQAFEWNEVKFKETYKFLVLHGGKFGTSPFMAYAELATPVAVEVGDTARVNLGSLVVEIP